LDQDWIWIYIFEKNWIKTGSGYWFDFYNEIFLRVNRDVTIDGGSVFFAMFFILSDWLNWSHDNYKDYILGLADRLCYIT